MKKKILFLVMMVLTSATAFPVEVEIDGLWYEVITKLKEAKVIQYKNDAKYSGNIVIPESVEYEGTTYNVTSIEEYAFIDCRNLFSIVISNNISIIGKGAFYDCRGLNSVTIPKSVTTIGDIAFLNCRNLQNVYISDIAAWCNVSFEFSGGYDVNYSNPITYAHCLILNGEKIKDLVIPTSVTTIREWAFSNLRNLNSVTLPNSIASIGHCAFRDCNDLNTIEIPSIVTSINYATFAGCSSLESVNIPNTVTNIESHAFENCSNLSSISIPSAVTNIEGYSFYGCRSLTTLTIPDGVTSIGVGAFQGCSGITTLTIPNSVKDIQWTAFEGCSCLSTLTIGDGVTNIESAAFANCPELINVYCYAVNVPSTTNDVFNGSYTEYATLHVPESSVETYKTTEPWMGFKEIVKILPIFSLKYIVDDVMYKSYQVEEGTTITPEPVPTKEGYTFSGWSEIPETMPAHDVTVTGTFNINKYKLTYTVDGTEYKTYDIEYGATITPEVAPTKEGYTFSGWSEIPETMPAHDVTVTGTFGINKYKLTYIVDGEEYKTYEVEYGATITPEAEPTKEGYTFSGWSEIPETMPAHEVMVTGTFSVNKYKLTYTVDGEEYKSYKLDYGASITPEAALTKEGYTFSGWSEIPETMPAHDVTVTGKFSINSYKLTYMIDDKVYKETMYEYGATITPEPQPEGDYATFEWKDLPQTMPAHDVIVYASYTSGIIEVLMTTQRNIRIYSPNGKKLDKLQKGLNIVVLDDGTVKKVVVK